MTTPFLRGDVPTPCAAQGYISFSALLCKPAQQVPAVRKAPLQEGVCHSANTTNFLSPYANLIDQHNNMWYDTISTYTIMILHFTAVQGGSHMAAKKVDISEAYDEIKNKRGTYVICFDIVGLIPINEISREAGDLAILEAARRIDAVSTEEMMQLRIGGDEFALITGSDKEEFVKSLYEKVLSHNGETIQYKEKEIPLNLRVGLIKVPEKGLRYSEFFSEMHEAINETRRNEK